MAKTQQSPAIEARLKYEEDFSITHPSLTRLAFDRQDIFTGLTVFLGDNNAVVIGVKRMTDDGKPEIMWTSGTDLLDAFLALENGLKAGRWRDDKKHPDYKG